MHSLGKSVVESPCAATESVIGRVSVADASLSLSLSLWARRLLAASPHHRGFRSRKVGFTVRPSRLGLHPRVTARLACISAFASCIVLVCTAAPALATVRHGLALSFGSAGSGSGQLASPTGVAVDNSTGPASGDVYVGDTGNSRVDQFDSNGNFIRAWGWGVADGLPKFETCTLSCQ